MDCTCPAPTALTAIENFDCGENMNQIQRLSFQRIGTNFDGTGATSILTLSVWQALAAAVDSTKVVTTPLIGGDPTIEAGDAITTGGGDNSTLNGVEEVEGVNPAPFSCVFKELPASIEKQLKALMCEPNLGVYLHLQGGKIAAKKVADNIHTGFKIQSVFVSDRNNAGFGTKDTVDVTFVFEAGWSEDLEILTPTFNPLTDL